MVPIFFGPFVWEFIHPASRGVAAHTASLFRSVRGAKGGFPPWGLPKLRIFNSPPVGAPQAREFSLFPPVGAPQARQFSLFPPCQASQAREFSLFLPLEALQAAEFQIAGQRRLDSPPNPVFFECVSMFLQWFPSKYGRYFTLLSPENRSKTSCSTMFPIPLSPQPLKILLFTVFSSIFPCANAGSQLQHIYKKSFQNIVFDSVFPMFPVKQTVIYTFFAIKAVNPSKTLLLTVFL